MIWLVDNEMKAKRMQEMGYKVFHTPTCISKVVGFTDDSKMLKYETKDLFLRKDAVYMFATSFTPQGEKLAFDLYTYLDVPFTEKRRVRIKEFTKEGIEEAMNSPLCIDNEKVKEYIRLETENYLFAFKITPWLWSQVSNSYEKKLSLNITQYNVLNQTNTYKYLLKAFFTKRHICFVQELDTLEEVNEFATNLIQGKFVLVKAKYRIPFFKSPLALSTEEILRSLQSLYCDGYINDENEIINKNVTPVNKNDKALFNYLNKEDEMYSKWILKDADNHCLIHACSDDKDDTFLHMCHQNLVLNSVDTVIQQNTSSISEYVALSDELYRMEYKGYIRLSNDKSIIQEVLPSIEYKRESGTIQQVIKKVSVKPSLLQPLGYIVSSFYRDNYEDFPQNKFEIKLDAVHSCVVAKYGLVIRRVDPETQDITFLKLKDSFDYKALYAGKYMNNFQEIIKSSSTTNNPLSRYINGEKLTLKKAIKILLMR